MALPKVQVNPPACVISTVESLDAIINFKLIAPSTLARYILRPFTSFLSYDNDQNTEDEDQLHA